MNYLKQVKNKNWKNEPFVMYLFLGIQIVVFLAMEWKGFGIGGSNNVYILTEFGAMVHDNIIELHEWWRLITPIFVHIGWMHLIVNSLTLYYIGKQLEGIFGHWRFTVIYLVSGIAGNAMSFGLNNSTVVSAGASTSLFGLFGTFLILSEIFKFNPAIRAMAQSFGLFIIINLAFNLMGSGVDIYGHLGGVIGGLLCSYAVCVPNPPREINIHTRIICGILSLVFIAGCLSIGMLRLGVL